MAQPLLGFLAFALGTVVVLTVPVLVVWVLVQVLKGLGLALGGGARLLGGAVRHVAVFVGSEVRDTVQFAGSALTVPLILPLLLASLLLGRFRSVRHYAVAMEDELTGALACLYRIGVGHPVRLVGLGALTDGIERRLPELVNREPRTGQPRMGRFTKGHSAGSVPRSNGRRGEISFPGYDVVEELQAGGSGARLFCAVPTAAHAKALGARGLSVPPRVVIKAFDLGYGSTIPQIVRESRSLEAAKKLGLILEHELSEGAFHYVMPFVPGEDLDRATRALHAKAGPLGLGESQLREVIAYSRDLCDQLSRFHGMGVWHKDIKPSNLMVADGRLNVVDFGLVTPLESALTLTTHGTEFFRDPELVRLALAGKRVKDVDGRKFDLYSAGAVLYSMVENSFPAHGSLSSISKRTPEALRWIVRRAMADVEKRYASAAEMARDIDVLALAKDPFSVRPADLPSVRGDAPPRENDLRHGAQTPPPLGAHRDATAQDEDVHRLHVLGMTAEIRGLGRMKGSLASTAAKHSRACRKERRRAAQEQQQEAALAAASKRTKARSERRSNRRNTLRAVLTVATFVGIIGGLASQNDSRPSRPPFTAKAVAAEPTDLHGEALSFLEGDADTEARYLEAALGSLEGRQDNTISRWGLDSKRRLHPSTEEEVAELGSMSRILIVTDQGDAGLVREARVASRRLRELGAIPLGVERRNRARDQRTDRVLVSTAQELIALSGGSIEEATASLEALTQSDSEVDGVLWLRRHPRTGKVRSAFATSGPCVSGSCASDDCGTSRVTSSCTQSASRSMQ